MIPPKNNKLWTDARGIPIRGKQIHEPITYVPETGFFRDNIPSPWDTNLSEGFNYGELPTPAVRYAVIERQPGQNAWSNKFTGVDDQLVMQQPDVDAYDFESKNYNRYKPVARQAAIVDDADDWEPWSNSAPLATTQPVENSGVITPPPRRAAVIGDDIDLEDLGLFDDVIPQGRTSTVIKPSVATPVVTPTPTLAVIDPYDFDGNQYTYRVEDDINNWRSQAVAIPKVTATPQQEPQHQQLEIDFNNPVVTEDTPLSYPVKEYLAKLSPLERLKLGFREGNSFGVGEDKARLDFDPNGKAYYAKSVIFDRAPKSKYDYLDTIGQAGFIGGRVASDIYGNGTRKILWEIHPEDFTNSKGKHLMNAAGASRTAQLAIPYGATLALGIGSGNYNPLNVSQGGRPDGFSAVNPDDDPRNSTSPLYDIAIERGMLGRRGRLLPWEQFHQERPDISFEQYDKYQRYLTNKDDNFLREATGGLAKGTFDGINGPEVNVMGYSVNPIGAAAAAGIIALGRKAILQR